MKRKREDRRTKQYASSRIQRERTASRHHPSSSLSEKKSYVSWHHLDESPQRGAHNSQNTTIPVTQCTKPFDGAMDYIQTGNDSMTVDYHDPPPIPTTVDADDDDEGLWVDVKDETVTLWDQRKTEVLDEMIRLKGRGVHISQTRCHSCENLRPNFRCRSCFSNGVLYCLACVCALHDAQPFHFVEVCFTSLYPLVSSLTLS
jgi:hypothetical protein